MYLNIFTISLNIILLHNNDKEYYICNSILLTLLQRFFILQKLSHSIDHYENLLFEVIQLATRLRTLPLTIYDEEGKGWLKNYFKCLYNEDARVIRSPSNAHYWHLLEIIKQLLVIIEIHGLHHRASSQAFLEREILETKLPFLLVSYIY